MMNTIITMATGMVMVANGNITEGIKTIQSAQEHRITICDKFTKRCMSYRAEKEVKETFEIYMVNDDPYEYVITFYNGGYAKGDVNSIVSVINRNSKYTAIMQDDELALVWSGNNCITVSLDDDDSDTEYYWAIYDGTAVD